MKKDTELWLQYADENLKSAEILLNSGLYNPSLQNSQQVVEKYLKAVLIENAAGLTRTHSIRELSGLLLDLAPPGGGDGCVGRAPLTGWRSIIKSRFLRFSTPIFSVRLKKKIVTA